MRWPGGTYPEDYLRHGEAAHAGLRQADFVERISAHAGNRASDRAAAPYTTGRFEPRGAAELFENQFLDLFQIRRCQENLEPSPQHPGCIYGEMNRCLRPCQQVVSPRGIC